MDQFLEDKSGKGLSDAAMRKALKQKLDSLPPLKSVLIIPPDITRLNAYAGELTKMLLELLPENCKVEIMPALGTHTPMTSEELDVAFPGIPHELFVVHDWRRDTVKLGTIPAALIGQLSQGRFTQPVDVEVNRRIVSGQYDHIFSIGQVVPHEVVGMANYNKNILVGCGGPSMINNSHALGAFYGMERMMGRDHSPVHALFDEADKLFLQGLPLSFILTVTTTNAAGRVKVHSLGVGRKREVFSRSIAVSQQKNILFLEDGIQKAVVYLRPDEFKSTWLGNKAIYRTRMAMADGGELIILAPGVSKFGEDPKNDELIRNYGYWGTEKIAKLTENELELQQNLSVTAHLIHGSSEGRFKITYAPGGLSKEEVEKAGFNYLSIDEAIKIYDPSRLKPGYNQVNGEAVYFIHNPALGLWALRSQFPVPNDQ